jgi:shikimate kinase
MLDAPFVDPDVDVERRAGRTIPEIFAAGGEAEFRRLEREAVRRALDGAPAVVAPGGGWGAAADALDEARERGALAVYLRCTPGEAVRRLGDCGNRPLLSDAADPATRMSELLAARESRYLAADHTVDTDGHTPDRVAREVVALAHRHGGW